MAKFNIKDLPDMSGKTALITGANSGLGLETAKALAAKGARIIMACRNTGKANVAASEIRAFAPNAMIDIKQLDLGNLTSVHTFADAVLADETKIDLLINNAGLFSGSRAETTDGHELQFGTNHLGHFVLNSKLLPLVEAAGGRIVVLGSMSHQLVKDYSTTDLNWEKRTYVPMQAYAQSKLANMLYTLELAKRLEAKNSSAMVVMAHPGFAATNISNTEDAGRGMKFGQNVTKVVTKLFAQPQSAGAWPTLLAATDPTAKQGDYYGPDGLGGTRGNPKKCDRAAVAKDEKAATELWEASEQLTNISFAL